MTNLDVTIVGSDGESHPIAREVHRQIREAIDRSEMSLRWLGEGENEKTVAEMIYAEGLLVREIGQQVVGVAYQLDSLVALCRLWLPAGKSARRNLRQGGIATEPNVACVPLVAPRGIPRSR